MTNEEYIKYKSVSYSTFKRWLKSPDYALTPFTPTEQTMFGIYFEDFAEERIKGNDDQLKGIDVTPYTFVKKYDKYKDEGVPEIWIEKANKMFKNIEKVRATSGKYEGENIFNLLTDGTWQKPVIGQIGRNDTPVKAKYDILYENPFADNYTLDIKTVSSLDKVFWAYRDGYYIQDYIYTKLAIAKGILSEGDSLIFVFIETQEPFNALVLYRESRFTLKQKLQLGKLNKCWEWIKAGKPSQGYRETVLV